MTRGAWRFCLVAAALAVLGRSVVTFGAELLEAQDKAPTIAEQQPESLWEFLQALPRSFEAELLMALIIGGTAGMLAHYVLKWSRHEIKENLFCYFWGNFRSTLYSFFAYVGIAIGAIGASAFFVEIKLDGITKDVFVGWKVVMWMAVTNGFTIDAIVNKTRRAEWSWPERLEQQRKEEAKP